ncbi:hypothetical protein [Metabacillus sp. SLBN-84]
MEELLILFIFLLVIIIALLMGYFVTKKVSPYMDSLGRKLSLWMLSKIKTKHKIVLIISESIYIIILLFTLYGVLSIPYSQEWKNYLQSFVILLTYSLFLIIFTPFIFELRKKISSKVGTLKFVSILNNKINKENYIINRFFLLFGRTGLGLYIYIITIIVLLSVINELQELPYQAYYIFLILIPIGLAIWVNITSFDKTSQNLRRILVYFLLFGITIVKSFYDFKILLDLEKANPFNDYLILLLLSIFVALDRLAKSIFDDYHDHMKFKKNEENCDVN